jgi:hypothetical protein
MFAVFEFGMAWWNFQQLSAAASEGARKAAVSRTADDPEADVIAAVKNAAPSLEEDDIDVVVDTTWASGTDVTVTATYPEKISIMGIDFFDGNLSSERTARVEP